MIALLKPIASLTASDLMSRDVVMIADQMSLQGAAKILCRSQVSGAPVVDGEGRIVGVLSSFDFVHWAENGGSPMVPCHDDERAWKPWQMLDHEKHAKTMVADVMTRDPVTASPKTHVADLARMMLDAHIHRVIIVDEDRHPIGVISSMDILAALAKTEPVHSEFD